MTSAWAILRGRKHTIDILLLMDRHSPVYKQELLDLYGEGSHVTVRQTLMEMEEVGLLARDDVGHMDNRCYVRLTPKGQDAATMLKALREALA